MSGARKTDAGAAASTGKKVVPCPSTETLARQWVCTECSQLGSPSTGGPSLMGWGQPLTAPPGLTAWGRSEAQAGIRWGQSGHHWRKSRGKSCFPPNPPEGKRIGIWLPFSHLAAQWDVWPREHLVLQWWQQQLEPLNMSPGQGRSFLFVKKKSMINFLFFSHISSFFRDEPAGFLFTNAMT